MRLAINVPNFGPFGDARAMAELAREAETVGWDGFFIWDHVLWTAPRNQPVADPWVTLAAMAMATTRITLGPMVTPLPRRRPWQVARAATTLDHLSGGRLVLGVGLGGDWFGDYSRFGESPDQKRHGAMLDEALDVLQGLWSGKPFSYAGEHFTIKDVQFLPQPTRPIPIWVAGVWSGTKPFRRAARWNGVAPIAHGENATIQPDDVRAMLAYIQQHREGDAPFEVVLSGPPLQSEQYAAYADAGTTWYQDGFTAEDSVEKVHEHIRRGPPKV